MNKDTVENLALIAIVIYLVKLAFNLSILALKLIYVGGRFLWDLRGRSLKQFLLSLFGR